MRPVSRLMFFVNLWSPFSTCRFKISRFTWLLFIWAVYIWHSGIWCFRLRPCPNLFSLGWLLTTSSTYHRRALRQICLPYLEIPARRNLSEYTHFDFSPWQHITPRSNPSQSRGKRVVEACSSLDFCVIRLQLNLPCYDDSLYKMLEIALYACRFWI